MTYRIEDHGFNHGTVADLGAALAIARDASLKRPCRLIEVVAEDGLVGQFRAGRSTPEFAHNDREVLVAMVDRRELRALLEAVGKLTVGDMRDNPRAEAIWNAFKDFSI